MKKADLFAELVNTYRKFGWELRCVLLKPETRDELVSQDLLAESAEVREAPIDALWFSRPSQDEREAWELRLLSENQYALFETFEPDETEEDRNDVRQEMEARLRDVVLKS